MNFSGSQFGMWIFTDHCTDNKAKNTTSETGAVEQEGETEKRKANRRKHGRKEELIDALFITSKRRNLIAIQKLGWASAVDRSW